MHQVVKSLRAARTLRKRFLKAGFLLCFGTVLSACGPSPEDEVFLRGRELYLSVCATCHMPDGRGMASHLVGSRWVLGNEDILVRIILQGKRGRADMDMPPHPDLDDESVAAILTYLRREWGHEAPPVNAATVARVRAETASRNEQWTQQELLSLEKKLSGGRGDP